MALTPAEQKKMERIKKIIAEKEKELQDIIKNGAQYFTDLAMSFDLWKLDKDTAKNELKALAKKHNLIK